MADPSGGPVLARSSTVLPCPVVPSGSLSRLHLPLFFTNLVSAAALQDAMVTTTTPGGQRVSICTCTRTSHHLATFTHQLGSSLYTLATKPPQVAASAQVSASGQVAPPCSCRLLSHQTLLWHHRLGHPPCHAFVRAAPHSSFPLTTAPLETFHMDVWGPARVSGQGRERYFLLVVDDYTRYTTVFPLRSKGFVPDVLITWIRVVRLQLRERFREDVPVLHLHSDRGVMEVARTSMIHAAAPHFLWLFAARYAAHQRNLWLRVSLLETSPTLRWTGEVGDALVFRVWGSRAFVHDTCADKLSARAISCVFLGFPPNAPGWQFYHPTSRRVFPSQYVTFDDSVPFYRLFPYRSATPPTPPLFLAPGPPLVDSLPPQGPAPSGVSQVDPLPATVPVESEGAGSGVAELGGAELGGAEPAGAEPGGVEPEGVEPGGAESEGAESGGAEPRGTTSSGDLAGASPRLVLGGAEPGGAESEGAGSGGAEPGGAEPEGAEPEGAEPGGAEPEGVEPRGAESEVAESGASLPAAVA
ncbi:unnamed protein product [Closterium sp. NIES-54]